MSRFDHRKYSPAPKVTGFTRTWPDQEITRAPIWVSEDLRDGNQALLEPMTVEQKQKLFKLLEALEENDDVQSVAANFSVSDDVMAKLIG